jgi:hypothetical protein
VLNHTPDARQITRRVYINHDYRQETRAALELWGAKLREIVSDVETSQQTKQEAA